MAQIFTKSWKKTPKHDNNYKTNELNNKRKNNDFDYNYEDWEEEEPNYYNFFINNTVTTIKDTTPTVNTTMDTTIDSPITTLPSPLTEVTPEATTEAVNDTIQETETIDTSNALEEDTTTKIITSTITTSLETKMTSTELPELDIFNQTTETEISKFKFISSYI